jgi:transcriptional regulator with XRE-family HTH domain
MVEFGKKVQLLRKNHNISQEKLAINLKINRNYLSRIETGKSEPTLSVICDIANFFRVDVATLMALV